MRIELCTIREKFEIFLSLNWQKYGIFSRSGTIFSRNGIQQFLEPLKILFIRQAAILSDLEIHIQYTLNIPTNGYGNRTEQFSSFKTILWFFLKKSITLERIKSSCTLIICTGSKISKVLFYNAHIKALKILNIKRYYIIMLFND